MAVAALGWLGTIGTFVAYLLVSRGRLTARSWRYASLNVIGGTSAGIAAVLYGAWFSAASNFFWAVIGIVTLAAVVARRPSAEPAAACSCQAPRVSLAAN